MVKSRKTSVLVLAVLGFMILAGFNPVPASAQAAANLSDISENWAFSQIFYLVDKGVVSGYADGTFRPNNPISRAEFVTITNRAFGYAATAPIDFADVKSGDWFYQEIGKAKAAGYIAGFPDGSMRPNDQISRQEVAVIIAQVLKLDTSAGGDLTFTDADLVPAWSRNAIAAMVRTGYLSGYPDGYFRPFNAISRAEAAVIISLSIGNRVSVSGVTMDKSVAVVAEGESITLAAAITPANATNQRVSWASADRNIALVSTTGTVTGVAVGKTTITVTTTDSGFQDTCQVTVVAPVPVTGVTLDQTSLTLIKGFTGKLAATVVPGEATNRTVTWSSSDVAVATVDHTGLVTAVAPGTATIMVRTLDGAYNAVCLVTVNAPVAVSGVSLNKLSTSITVGYSETLLATIFPGEATNKAVTWSSSDPLIATVSSTGQVTALAAGTAIIAVTSNEGAFTTKCNILVTEPITVTGVSLSQTSISLKVGETDTLVVSVSPSNASNINVDWFSSNSNIASISNGIVTAVAPGLATIMVRTQDGGKTDLCDVIVSAL